MSTNVLTGYLRNEGTLTEYTNKHGATGYIYRNVISMATSQKIAKENPKTGETEQRNLRTFMPFVMLGNRAKVFADTYHKGDIAHLAGEIMPREVQREDGTQYMSFEFRAFNTLKQNQARRLHETLFNMTNPDYAKQRDAEQQTPAVEENDFSGYDDMGEAMDM